MEKLEGGISPEDLVTLLRSPDMQSRQCALDFLYGGDSSVVLITATRENVSLAATPKPDMQRLFTGLVWAAQQVGRACGMQLAWVGAPQNAQALDKKLIVAPHLPLP